MKKLLSVSIIFLMCLGVMHAQLRIQKTATSGTTKSTPMVVNQPVGTIKATVIQPTGNFNNPSSVITLPDGRRITMTLRQNPVNLPANFGGNVKETTESSTKSADGDMTCTSEVRSINAQSSTFMNVNYNQQAIHIFPGAMYTFANFFSGNFRPIEQGRNPIYISTDNLANSSGSVSEQVQNPTAENIRTKIAAIIRPFSTTTGSAGIQYRVFNSENDADLSIKLSAGGGYAGFKASAGYSGSQTEKKYYMTIDAIKPLYTLTTSVPANGYLSDKSIEASNPNLIVLKSVTYGTRILANLEITVQSRKDDIDFKASYGADSGKGVSTFVNAAFNYLRTSKNASSTANVFVVGGPLSTTLFDRDKLQEQITDLLSKCNYQTAQPIAYSFTDINGNVLGIESATDKFTIRKCVPAGSVYKLVSASVQINTGKDNKEQGSNASVYLSNSNNVIVFENTSNNIQFTSQNEITLNSLNRGDSYIAESSFSKAGGYVDIFFDPKPIFLDFDEWNISSAVLTLTFMDQNGTLDAKQINYNSAAVLLKKNQQRIRLPFDNMYRAGSPFMPGL